MNLQALNKRKSAIDLLLRKYEYERDVQLKHYGDLRARQNELSARLDRMQAEIQTLREGLAARSALYRDEISRVQGYVREVSAEQSGLVMDLLKINGQCQRQLEGLQKIQAKIDALGARARDCRTAVRSKLEKILQDAVDEDQLFRHHQGNPPRDTSAVWWDNK